MSREQNKTRFPYNYEGRKAQQARVRSLNRVVDAEGKLQPAPVFPAGNFFHAPTGERALGRHPSESVDSYVGRLRAAGEVQKADAIEARRAGGAS